jgi:hypothetical protein
MIRQRLLHNTVLRDRFSRYRHVGMYALHKKKPGVSVFSSRCTQLKHTKRQNCVWFHPTCNRPTKCTPAGQSVSLCSATAGQALSQVSLAAWECQCMAVISEWHVNHCYHLTSNACSPPTQGDRTSKHATVPTHLHKSVHSAVLLACGMYVWVTQVSTRCKC